MQPVNQLDGMIFIWGVTSYHDISGKEKADLVTLNDIDIVYDSELKKYCLGIELAYQFENGILGQQNYLQQLLDRFKNWMIDPNKRTDSIPLLYEHIDFNSDYYIKADNIEDLYGIFKWSVEDYCKE